MRPRTRSFYERAVHQAIEAVVGGLDDALDLECLARGAALSPFHFHRIFRGMVGETPLQLHRRLQATPESELRSDAAITVPEGAKLPDGVTEILIPAGRYACTTHIGPYTQLPDAWARLMGQWLPESGERVGEGGSYEIYVNTPQDTPAEELRTELYVPLA